MSLTTVPAAMTDEGVTAAQITALQGRCTTLEALKTTNGTLVATTSGTSKDFTGIPSTAKRVVLLLNGVSLSGTANLLMQVGSTTMTTAGYAGGASQAGASPSQTTSTAGLLLSSSSVAASTHTGRAVFELIDPATNTWIGTSTITRSDGYGEQGGTVIALGGALDRIRLTTSNGTDTFDAGSANIIYE